MQDGSECGRRVKGYDGGLVLGYLSLGPRHGGASVVAWSNPSKCGIQVTGATKVQGLLSAGDGIIFQGSSQYSKYQYI